jgi:hypothetical protein
VSPDETSGNRVPIASQPGLSAFQGWDEDATQKSALRYLQAGVAVSETGTPPLRAVSVGDLYTAADPAHPHRFLRLQVATP